jgi:hypothetical protein
MSEGRVRSNVTIRLQRTAVAAFGLQFVFANPVIISVIPFPNTSQKVGFVYDVPETSANPVYPKQLAPEI